MSIFGKLFREITGNSPYPWQTRLYEQFSQGAFPSALDIPTGLGKTSVMTIWMLALATRTDCAIHIPTRLVYVVDRRAIVDQASAEALRLQAKISTVCGGAQKLNVSSLRGGGGSADGQEWLMEPHVSAIIVGTIDMIGSRLLFSGYGVGMNSRPFYAGMLGQDSLIILDETHLSPAMEMVLSDAQSIAKDARHVLLPPRVMFMSATQRSGESADMFSLNDKDMRHPEIRKRYESEKILNIVEAEDVVQMVEKEARHMKGKVLVYLEKPRDVQKVSSALRKSKERVVTLTGTIRGFERDERAQDRDYIEFESGKPSNGRCFLISTSAGEVGVDLDADNMVCDLTTLDSMIQRLGRVNRSGGRQAKVTVVYARETIDKGRKGKNQKGKVSMEELRKNTLEILRDIAEGKIASDETTGGRAPSASPATLSKIPHDRMKAAFSPTPETQPLTHDILDMWSMTSLYQKYASRPSVQYWLHGKPEAQAPETYVAWRADVQMIAGLGDDRVQEILDEYRILPHEIARGSSADVYRILQGMGDTNAVVLSGNACTVKKTSSIGKNEIEYATVLLPCSAGGLIDGMLESAKHVVDDVADKESRTIWQHGVCDTCDGDASGSGRRPLQRRRARIVVSPDGDGRYRVTGAVVGGSFQDQDIALKDWLEEHSQMTLVYRAELGVSGDEDEASNEIMYYVEMPSRQGSAFTKKSLDEHHAEVEEEVGRIVSALDVLGQDLSDALIMAARIHDYGKARDHWQRCMRVAGDDRPLAKTGRRIRPLPLGGFRHEFASVVDSSDRSEVAEHPERDLILHLVAAHHGRARPCFKPDVLMDGGPRVELYNSMSRYARLQSRFGPWGLAWLEGLLRGADWATSAARDGRRTR